MPTYLSSLLEQYRPTRSLRSSSLDILSVPRSRTKTASHHFSIAARSVWNSLPATIRAASSVGSFRSQLKHTCTILASIDHSRYPHFCSFGNSSALQILTLIILALTLMIVISYNWFHNTVIVEEIVHLLSNVCSNSAGNEFLETIFLIETSILSNWLVIDWRIS